MGSIRAAHSEEPPTPSPALLVLLFVVDTAAAEEEGVRRAGGSTSGLTRAVVRSSREECTKSLIRPKLYRSRGEGEEVQRNELMVASHQANSNTYFF
jgi:hypothetical protein